MADRVAVMRSGKILQDASPEAIYDDPVDTFVADFVGNMNLFTGKLAAMDGGAAVVECDVGLRLFGLAPTGSYQAGSSVALAVRPERVTITRCDGEQAEISSDSVRTRVIGRVVHRTFLGDHLSYRVHVEGMGVVTVRSTRSAPSLTEVFATDEKVTLEWALDGARVIPDSGRATNGNGKGSEPEGKEETDERK